MKNRINRFVAASILLVGLLVALPVSAQVTLTQTRLSAAVTTANDNTITVVSATTFAAGTTHAVIDAEEMAVTSVSGTTIGVVRGINGTRATTHAASAVVYVGSPTYFDSVGRFGSCTAANERVLPIIVPTEAKYYTCSSSAWVSASLVTLGGYATMPSTSGGIPTLYSCGSTAGTSNCGNTASGHTAKIWTGRASLTGGTAIISGLSPAFTSVLTGACVSQDQDTASGATTSMAVISGVSSITITGSGTGAVWYICVGY